MKDLSAGDLSIQVSQQDSVLTLNWEGKSADRHPKETLEPFFREVAITASTDDASIEMHFERLEHFNSSTITVLIQYIQELRKKKVPLKIVYNGSYKWQKLSFDALKIFDKGDGLLSFEALNGS